MQKLSLESVELVKIFLSKTNIAMDILLKDSKNLNFTFITMDVLMFEKNKKTKERENNGKIICMFQSKL